MAAQTLASRGVRWLVALAYAIPGIALMAGVPHFIEDMARLGFPGWFAGFLGAAKVLGAAAILLPVWTRLREWAYAGLIFDAVAAVAARLAIGDGLLTLLPAVLIGATVLLCWCHQPYPR
jgi:hypothetical protein